jgi:glycosyltransferase involved in cell wall biosynthesis
VTPRVSVVLGVFEGAAVLDETLASIAAQTLGDFECIAVDDGSTDPRVAALLADWVQRDGRFRVMRQQNQGLTRALIAGCAEARGAFIARIDVGDTMAPERLAAQAAVLERYPDCAFVAVQTQVHGPAWEPLYVNGGRGPWPVPGWILHAERDAGFRGGIPHHGSVMMRRSAKPRMRCKSVTGDGRGAIHLEGRGRNHRSSIVAAWRALTR